jgi:hypothetical protein
LIFQMLVVVVSQIFYFCFDIGRIDGIVHVLKHYCRSDLLSVCIYGTLYISRPGLC